MRTLEELTRPNIRRLKPYSSARDEYNGAAASVFSMQMKIRTICRTTAIRTRCNGS